MTKAFPARLHFHWTNKKGKMVPKVQFQTLEDALRFMEKNGIDKKKYNPYVCPDCQMWHIGHSKK